MEFFLVWINANGLAIFRGGLGDLRDAFVALAQQIVGSGLLRLGCSERHGDLEFFLGYRTKTGISQPLARGSMRFAILWRNTQQFFSLLFDRSKITRLNGGAQSLQRSDELGIARLGETNKKRRQKN